MIQKQVISHSSYWISIVSKAWNYDFVRYGGTVLLDRSDSTEASGLSTGGDSPEGAFGHDLGLFGRDDVFGVAAGWMDDAETGCAVFFR